ncbi:unnamed protein product [Brachionus calyciflorus]|uniref:Uncharacterized protein n=1 Tax=Brachionus calyciflorus TaxID=104777 RepID=A0A814HLV7_9BILA|nr:unnamed protein product [Brachionus calyciflorus]
MYTFFLEANKSRLVTKCRWVEDTNSFLKRSFCAIESVSNAELNHTLDDHKIAAAFINKYFKFLFSDNDKNEIARKMKLNISKSNDLCKIVIDNKLHKKSNFEKIEYAKINDFPILTINQITNEITFGNYQIIQAKSYLGQHFSTNGKNEIMVDFQIQINGMRTVGCCSHVASLILYFSNLKYLDNIVWPPQNLQHFFDSDNSDDESVPNGIDKNLTHNKDFSLEDFKDKLPEISSIKRNLSDLNSTQATKKQFAEFKI